MTFTLNSTGYTGIVNFSCLPAIITCPRSLRVSPGLHPVTITATGNNVPNAQLSANLTVVSCGMVNLDSTPSLLAPG